MINFMHMFRSFQRDLCHVDYSITVRLLVQYCSHAATGYRVERESEMATRCPRVPRYAKTGSFDARARAILTA